MNEIVNYNVSFNNATEAFEYWYDQIMKNGFDTEVGTYTHIAHDMHIYERHYNMKEKNQ